MTQLEIVIPRLGESVIEATITRWLKKEGDPIAEDEPIVEVATDKVDSEIPSPIAGVLYKKLFQEGETIAVGKAFAILTTEDEALPAKEPDVPTSIQQEAEPKPLQEAPSSSRFYSPLVKSIARQENISFAELDRITGTGKNDRLTRHDLMNYIANHRAGSQSHLAPAPLPPPAPVHADVKADDQIIEMDRIRQLIASHMVKSAQTSPHVTSVTEADMSHIVAWREQHKDEFHRREGEKLTYTPILISAIARAVRDYPMMNVSVDGNRIIVHKGIHVGMAVALSNSNLIVPVVRDADQKSLLGLIRNVNDLANRARLNRLVPDEISGGTISLTNLGSFGTMIGTPIINQPQFAIVAAGAIRKRPIVLESPAGDSIAIRPMMFLSVTFDHRVIDGALAGQFLNRLVEYLEQFDPGQTV